MRQLCNQVIGQTFFSVVDSKSVFFGYLIFLEDLQRLSAKVKDVENF